MTPEQYVGVGMVVVPFLACVWFVLGLEFYTDDTWAFRHKRAGYNLVGVLFVCFGLFLFYLYGKLALALISGGIRL